MPILALNNVSKSFGNKIAVRDLSFSLQTGEIFGFLGGNGAGKTTSLRMILNIATPDSGKIEFFGKPIQPEHLHNISFLPEERGLYRNMTAIDTLVYFGRLKGLTRNDALQRAKSILNRFGLSAESQKKLTEFSKGMAQKVQIGIALINEPKLLILDEPFSGLDPINQTVLEDEILCAAQNGTTVLFSTHIMQHAERLSQRILILKQGETRFHGTVAEALRSVGNTVMLTTTANPTSIPGITRAECVSQDSSGWNRWAVTLGPEQSPSDLLLYCTQNALPLTAFEQPRPTLHDAFIHIAGNAASPVSKAA
ncbi:ABC transporter ATP-binding protein [Neokomagataea thailandica NBRC 106555]|uniref:ATP-binding cassette domain-containing protein n=2 Tax=Neokomagataea TaxID=1223423 RepID=A0A4Y6V6N7_9PROT|nr:MULTISPECIES: ATP-binding cassette domain-containing protein [Neokomagataea]QDH24271.1 ATP-binding cassette domain-containing protein [Neokomagataea tanensis]GBR52998.1 ABC transporter ATP-binding protein [Neokomagataea thailandica NBRC 106555]